ncbi:MAG: FAD-binding oxidoreductase [Chitinophagales bacterium]|nr:FAD-binding oxidoreductase [Chitinophagales bacterium]
MQLERRNFWGWGYADYLIPEEVVQRTLNYLRMGLGIKEFEKIIPPRLEDIELSAPRFEISEQLQAFCVSDKLQRAGHSYGKSYRDVWRGLKGIFEHTPDYIAFPRTEEDIQQLFDFALPRKIALIPYGGGSSVCGGVEPQLPQGYNGCITVDMFHFNQVLEIDKVSRSARIQAGIYGLDLENKLRAEGLTLRHYPQSFEFSTLGGWIATRSGGHFATLYTHIDEFVQSVRMITPQGGVFNSRRLPGSGAGPSEERLVCGSEGTLGIITEAWMRLQDIPKFKKTVTIYFKDFEKGADACRILAQSGLNPSNARLISSMEAFSNGLGDGAHAVLIIGFESAYFEVDNLLEKAIVLCVELGGILPAKKEKNTVAENEADDWKQAFIRAPYLRDELIKNGLVVETFETAITWDKFRTLHREIESQVYATLQRLGMKGLITCRFTHIYPDGPAPYYTVIAQGKKQAQLEEWDEIKSIVSDVLIENGATITHHHAVGRDHRPWYEQQASGVFQDILRSAKSAVDTQWVLNPGVLILPDNDRIEN